MACRLAVVGAMLGVALAALVATSPAGAQALEPSGVWLTQQGDAKVRVSKCGGGICGVIVWLREPTDSATGKPATDSKNPNPALASRPMIGLPLFSGMQPSGPHRSGRARSTMPMTATCMPATSRWLARSSSRSKAASARFAAARPGPARADPGYIPVAFSAVAAEA